MSKPKRLHLVAAFLNILRQLKELIFPFLLVVVFGSRGEGSGNLPFILATCSGLLLALILGILSWYRFSYRIEDGEFRIESGLFVRKKRYIPFERIQSLDVSEGIFHRPFGLVKVKVETAGGAGGEEAEAVLTAIAKEEANHIHDIILSVKNERQAGEDSKEVVSQGEMIYKISLKELLLLASTSSRVGVVISAVFAFVLQFSDVIPYETVFEEVEHYISFGILFISVVLFLGLFLAWIISVIGTMLKYAGFTLKKIENDLVITRGLLEKKQFTIPLQRIQAIRVTENLLRQPLGMASVYVESAGGSALNEEGTKVLILPVIRKRRIASILEPYLVNDEFEQGLIPAPRRSFRRYLLKGWFIAIPLVTVLNLFLSKWGYIALLLLPASSVWSWFVYKDAGWGLNQGLLVLRYRHIVKNTVFMKKKKIQSLSAKQSFFQAKGELATIEATVKSGLGGSGGKVIDLDSKDVETIYRWYSYAD